MFGSSNPVNNFTPLSLMLLMFSFNEFKAATIFSLSSVVKVDKSPIVLLAKSVINVKIGFKTLAVISLLPLAIMYVFICSITSL